jgi:hypothetical protein
MIEVIRKKLSWGQTKITDWELSFFFPLPDIQGLNTWIQPPTSTSCVSKNLDLQDTQYVAGSYVPKGQLILKRPFGVFISSKKQRNFVKDFWPSHLRGQIKKNP